jgi:hypothetical protein
MNFYVHEKLRELDAEQLKNTLYIEPVRHSRPSLFGHFAAGAGRTLRRAGERLESWANQPETEGDPQMVRRTAR